MIHNQMICSKEELFTLLNKLCLFVNSVCISWPLHNFKTVQDTFRVFPDRLKNKHKKHLVLG